MQTLHFNSILIDPFNTTGHQHILEEPTDFSSLPIPLPPKRVSMSVPIVLPVTDYTKMVFEASKARQAALVNKFGTLLGVIHNPGKATLLVLFFSIIGSSVVRNLRESKGGNHQSNIWSR